MNLFQLAWPSIELLNFWLKLAQEIVLQLFLKPGVFAFLPSKVIEHLFIYSDLVIELLWKHRNLFFLILPCFFHFDFMIFNFLVILRNLLFQSAYLLIKCIIFDPEVFNQFLSILNFFLETWVFIWKRLNLCLKLLIGLFLEFKSLLVVQYQHLVTFELILNVLITQIWIFVSFLSWSVRCNTHVVLTQIFVHFLVNLL